MPPNMWAQISKSAFFAYNSTGSKAYEFKAWANHHCGTFGSSSCSWSREKKAGKDPNGKIGKTHYLQEGPGWT